MTEPTPDVLRYADGETDLMGAIYRPKRATSVGAAVLIYPDVLGVGRQSHDWARRIAGRGYVAVVCDLHGAGKRMEALDEAQAAVADLRRDPDLLIARTLAAYDATLAATGFTNDRLAAVGFCFGGMMALELARRGRLAGVAALHATLSSRQPVERGSCGARILACIGADDPIVSRTQRAAFEEEMTRRGADWRLNVYGGAIHSFTDPDAHLLGKPDVARFDTRVTQMAWSDVITFFEALFSSPD